MNTSSTNRNYFHTDAKNYVAKFLKANQYVSMSNWSRNLWFLLLKNSFLLRISEKQATEVTGAKFNGPCTIAIYNRASNTWLIIVDKTGCSEVNLSTMSPRDLEKIGAKLWYNSLGPAIYTNETSEPQTEVIQNELDKLEKMGDPVYLAGV